MTEEEKPLSKLLERKNRYKKLEEIAIDITVFAPLTGLPIGAIGGYLINPHNPMYLVYGGVVGSIAGVAISLAFTKEIKRLRMYKEELERIERYLDK